MSSHLALYNRPNQSQAPALELEKDKSGDSEDGKKIIMEVEDRVEEEREEDEEEKE